jgi:dUTP pyrophosphatase
MNNNLKVLKYTNKMSNFTSNNINNYFINSMNNLFNIYDKVMYLKIFVDGDNNLKQMYETAANIHNNKILNNPYEIDAGFDLYNPEIKTIHANNKKQVHKFDLNVICSAKMVTDCNKSFNTGYYMYPRSSLSKTKLRLANSIGIIDSGYRGHLMGMFDVVHLLLNEEYVVNKSDRLLQICAPGLVPIIVEVVNTLEELGEETERGSGGFGSTGR